MDLMESLYSPNFSCLPFVVFGDSDDDASIFFSYFNFVLLHLPTFGDGIKFLLVFAHRRWEWKSPICLANQWGLQLQNLVTMVSENLFKWEISLGYFYLDLIYCFNWGLCVYFLPVQFVTLVTDFLSNFHVLIIL